MLNTAGKLQHASLHHTQRLIMCSHFQHNLEPVPATQDMGGAEGFSSDQRIPSGVPQGTEEHTETLPAGQQ